MMGRPFILGYSTSKADTLELLARGLRRKSVYEDGYRGETLAGAIEATRGRVTALCVMRRMTKRLPMSARSLSFTASLSPLVSQNLQPALPMASSTPRVRKAMNGGTAQAGSKPDHTYHPKSRRFSTAHLKRRI